MAIAPVTSGGEFLKATKEVSKEVTKKSWVAGLMISMIGIRGKMDLDNVDPNTGLVTVGANAGSTSEDIINDAVTEIGRMQDEYDPDKKAAKLKMQARSPWTLPAGQTLDTLKATDPTKAAEIQEAAVDGLVDNFIGSTHTFAQEDAFLTGLGARIDAGTVAISKEKSMLEINRKVSEITTKYESGEITSIDELITLRDQTINPELRSSIDTKIQEYNRARDLFTSPAGGNLTAAVLNQALSSMTPPLQNIYHNIITQAEAQLTRATTASLAEIAAQRAETAANNPDANEIAMSRFKNIIKYGGPALLIALLCTGAGAGIGAMSAAGAASAIGLGVGIGGSVGTIAGGISWTFSGGYKEWRKIGAMHARSIAEVSKFEERAGEIRGKNSLKQLDFVDLLTEAATRGEAISRGLRTEEQFKNLRKEIGGYTGSGVNRADLDKSIQNIFNTQFKPPK
jgi:hypothetical protein